MDRRRSLYARRIGSRAARLRAPDRQPDHSSRPTLRRRARPGDVGHRHQPGGQTRGEDRVMGELDESLFLEGDDGLMRGAETDGAPPRPAEGYVTCPLAWLARVLPQV